MASLCSVWSVRRRVIACLAAVLALQPTAAPAQQPPLVPRPGGPTRPPTIQPGPGPGPSPDDELGTPTSLKDKQITYSLGEVIQIGPDPDVLAIKEAYVNRPNVIREILPRERNTPVFRAQSYGLGVAQVTLVGQNGKIKSFTVQIMPSLEYTRELIKRQFPTANLRLSAVGDNLLLVEGAVETTEEITAIIQFLSGFQKRGEGQIINGMRATGVMQVQLQVCIAKVDRTEARRIAANFLRSEVGNFQGLQTGNLIGVPTINARGGGNASAVFTNFAGGAATTAVLSPDSTIYFGITHLNSAFFGFLEALKQEGHAKILATPTLVTLNGRPADFLVGGEQPVPKIEVTPGGTAQGVEYRQFGTHLTFVPIVLGEGRIRLNLIPEVSRLTADTVLVGGTAVPRVETQRLNTTVEMESGQTLALGGLLQSEESVTVTKVPVLGDIPGLGVLFRRVESTTHETELLVLVTPVLVDPLRGCQRPAVLPGQESRAPNDCELYLKGMGEVPIAPPGAPPVILPPPPSSFAPVVTPTLLPPGVCPAPAPAPAVPGLPPYRVGGDH